MQNANSRPLGRSGRYGAKDLNTVNIKHIHNHFVNSNDDMSQLKKHYRIQRFTTKRILQREKETKDMKGRGN